MASQALISWNAPAHFYTEKRPDWYWTVGIITIALAVVAFIFGQIITGIFVIVAAVALALHASNPPKRIYCEINDRGLVIDNVLYPFLSLDSFYVPHDMVPARLIIKSRKLLMPLIVVYIEEIDPDNVRDIMLNYIAETEHREPLLKHVLEAFGF